MTILREAAQQALEALEAMQSYAAAERKGLRICDEAIPALRAALAQQAEPLNLSDPAVQKRLATQWGYVPAAQAEPVEPVAGVVLNEEGRAALVEYGREEWHCVVRNARRLYTAPPKDEPKPMHPELRKMWEDHFDKCFRAMPVPEQVEPVEPVATLIAQRDALLEAYRKMKNVAAGYSNLCDGSAFTRKLEREFEAADAIARAAIKAVKERRHDDSDQRELD